MKYLCSFLHKGIMLYLSFMILHLNREMHIHLLQRPLHLCIYVIYMVLAARACNRYCRGNTYQSKVYLS